MQSVCGSKRALAFQSMICTFAKRRLTSSPNAVTTRSVRMQLLRPRWRFMWIFSRHSSDHAGLHASDSEKVSGLSDSDTRIYQVATAGQTAVYAVWQALTWPSTARNEQHEWWWYARWLGIRCRGSNPARWFRRGRRCHSTHGPPPGRQPPSQVA